MTLVYKPLALLFLRLGASDKGALVGQGLNAASNELSCPVAEVFYRLLLPAFCSVSALTAKSSCADLAGWRLVACLTRRNRSHSPSLQGHAAATRSRASKYPEGAREEAPLSPYLATPLMSAMLQTLFKVVLVPSEE